MLDKDYAYKANLISAGGSGSFGDAKMYGVRGKVTSE
jgi:hypothetical protein